MATQVLQPQTLTTTLNYHLDAARGGAEIWLPGTVSDKRRLHDSHQVTVTNIRGHEEDFTLDKQGFQVGLFNTAVPDAEDDKDFTGQYYQDVIAYMKQATGATKVLPVAHITRRRPFEAVKEAEKDLPERAPVTSTTYNRSVHIDQSYEGAVKVRDNKLDNYPTKEIEHLRNCRWAIINLWRPLGSPVTRDNLGVCDARTVDEKDLCAVQGDISDKLKMARAGYNFSNKSRLELWEIRANPAAHKWYYAANLRPDEALLIKIFDSKLHGVARRTPHSAFASQEDYGPPRQSIEVRCLVFWEDQAQE